MKLVKGLSTVIILITVFLLNEECTRDADDPSREKCDCQTALLMKEKKDVEAVVVLITSYQDSERYVLSTEPNDFAMASHTVGENILVPCDLIPTQFQQAGMKVIVSYKRKKCYGAITQPTFHSYYGYYIDLKSIRKEQ